METGETSKIWISAQTQLEHMQLRFLLATLGSGSEAALLQTCEPAQHWKGCVEYPDTDLFS